MEEIEYRTPVVPVYVDPNIGNTSPQHFLITLSRATGGIAVINDQDRQKGLREAYRDSTEYYLMGYVPNSERRPKSFHHIEVKVAREAVEVRARKGYLEIEEEDALRDNLLNAFRFPGLFADFPMNTHTSEAQQRIQVEVTIPARNLTFARERDEYYCIVELYGALVDVQGKWVGDKLAFQKSFTARIDESELDRLAYDNLNVPFRVEAPRGDCELIVVARQLPAGRITAKRQGIRLDE
jgi:hypothetical protein